MAIAIVNSAHAGSDTGGDATTSAIDTTGANLLVAAVAYESYSTLTPISDSKGNTWTALTQRDSGTGRCSRLFYVASPTVGTGHTFTFGNGTGIYPVGVVLALSGAAASPFDVENGAGGGVASSLATGSVTPSEDNEILVSGACLGWPSVPSVSINSSFTLEFFGYGATSTGGGLAYQIQTTATARNPTWSFDTAHCAVSIATFKAAAAATKAPPIFRRSTRFFRRSA